MRKAVVTAASLAFGACATSADNVSAAYVSPLLYQSLNCDQLIAETHRIGGRVSEVTGHQNKQANNDAVAMGVGLVVFWPALFFLAGGSDKKEELARLKGEYDAVEQVGIQKGCISKPLQSEAKPSEEDTEE